MMFDYRYPAGGWEAITPMPRKLNALALAGLIHELMNMRGVKVRSDYEGSQLKGYAVKLDLGDAVSIKFSDSGVITKLVISFFNKDEDKERDIFFEIWQNLINNDYVSDEHFKSQVVITKSKEMSLQAETVRNYNGDENQEIKKRSGIVYRWLGRKTEFIRKTLPDFLDDYRDEFPTEKAFFDYEQKMFKAGLIDKKGKLYSLKKNN